MKYNTLKKCTLHLVKVIKFNYQKVWRCQNNFLSLHQEVKQWGLPLKKTSNVKRELKRNLSLVIEVNMTNGICCLGANITHLNKLLDKSNASEMDIRKALEKQREYLRDIQSNKDEVVRLLNL